MHLSFFSPLFLLMMDLMPYCAVLNDGFDFCFLSLTVCSCCVCVCVCQFLRSGFLVNFDLVHVCLI